MPPLYKTYNTPNNYYVFDTPTGHIVKVGKFFKSLLHHLLEEKSDAEIFSSTSTPLSVIKEVRRHFALLQKNNIFCDIESTEVLCNNRVLKQDDTSVFPPKIKNIAFKVTDHCNMSCRYCFQHGLGQPRKTINAAMMSFATAKLGIDHLMRNSDSTKSVTISFYGGEPFLNFKLISSIVNYVNRSYPDREVGYIVTSNGTKITDEIMHFLIVHRFGFLLSLDGPPEINNRYRIMKNKSKSQYDEAIGFLQRIRGVNQRYADASIKLCMTLSPPVDYTYLADFVNKLRVQPVVNLCDQSEFPPDLRIPWESVHQEELFCRFMRLVDKHPIISPNIPNDLYNSFEFAVFFSLLKTILNRRVGDPKINIGKLGFCVPGKVKPMVHPDGYIYICEKVEGLEYCRIGHVKRGFDKKKLSAINAKYEQIDRDKCNNCWLVNMCPICLFHIAGINGISEDRRSFYCDSIKRNMLKGIEFYTRAMESNSAKMSKLFSSTPQS